MDNSKCAEIGITSKQNDTVMRGVRNARTVSEMG